MSREELIGAIPDAFHIFAGARALARTDHDDRDRHLYLAQAYEGHMNGLLEALHEKLESRPV